MARLFGVFAQGLEILSSMFHCIYKCMSYSSYSFEFKGKSGTLIGRPQRICYLRNEQQQYARGPACSQPSDPQPLASIFCLPANEMIEEQLEARETLRDGLQLCKGRTKQVGIHRQYRQLPREVQNHERQDFKKGARKKGRAIQRN